MSATGMTFSSLKQSLKDYTEHGSSSDTAFLRQLPQIINNAERSLANVMKVQGYMEVLTNTMVAHDQAIPKPSGWRNTVTFSIGTGTSNASYKILRARSYELMRMIAPDPTAYDRPTWYSDYDYNHWFVAPTPDQAYPYQAIVYRLPDLLSDSNQTNYLTDLVPNFLLFECLTNMEPFLRNDARMPMWKEMRDDEFKAVDFQEVRKMADRAQTRTVV